MSSLYSFKCDLCDTYYQLSMPVIPSSFTINMCTQCMEERKMSDFYALDHEEIKRVNEMSEERKEDNVNHPKHYTNHPSGVEAITVTEHMGFCLGNVMKYIWRSEHKNGLEDLKKAQWYLTREIERREKENNNG